jgi:hypothetical protein
MKSLIDDEALQGWVRWAYQDGPIFLQRIAEAALASDLKHYNLMRPLLLKLKKEWPRPA